ncbi:MAG: alanine racemase [Eubacteriales bacterium]|nr:alanine racemase [Eubacteriales bacterium]MDD4134403.1 alanine racemase [Eubacteriales bacterium]NLO13547.1 alanine racemase [Clostridiales bacterium]
MYRRTFARVDLGAYAANVGAVRRMMGPDVKLLAVVKASAYGHGLLPVARAAEKAGADWLGVAITEEGEFLREAGIRLPILVLAPVNAAGALAAVRCGLTLSVFTPDHIQALQAAAIASGLEARAHVKLDTGMNRVGVKTEQELVALLEAACPARGVKITGAFTHFADGGNPDTRFNDGQLARFGDMLTLLPPGLLIHAAASATLPRPEARFDMVRAGISLFGYLSVAYSEAIRPVLTWEAEITHVKDIGTGEAVGYGVTYRAKRPVKVATIAVGYGDGYSRSLSGKGQVLVNGRRCPIIGRLCMDQMMVDVSGAGPVYAGDNAVLLGQQGEEHILADEIAGWMGTISYEVLLAISQRVPRIYVE